MGNNDQAWKSLCEFVKHRPVDDPEPWEVTTVKPTVKPVKRTRKRKLTLDRAMRQASKAGIAVSSATLTPDGVKLELGEATNQTNPWDSVQ